jgi:hypothetical protein
LKSQNQPAFLCKKLPICGEFGIIRLNGVYQRVMWYLGFVRKRKLHFFLKKIAKIVGGSEKSSTFAVAIEQTLTP